MPRTPVLPELYSCSACGSVPPQAPSRSQVRPKTGISSGFPTPSEPRVLTAVAAGAGPHCTRGANYPPRTATHLPCLHLRLHSFLGRGAWGRGGHGKTARPHIGS